MKQIVINLCLLAFVSSAFSQQDQNIKKGWSVGVLPVVAFNSDLGFEYGAVLNLFDFGDGSGYPQYNQSLYFEISRYTKGSGIYRFYYDTRTLLPGMRLIADLSYLPDRANDFFGFNGFKSVYNRDWEDQDSEVYKSRMFYKLQRNLFRIKADVQGRFLRDNVKWIAGFTGRNFDVSSVDIAKFNKGKDEEDKLPPLDQQPGLYEKYKEWGLIPENEQMGGYISTLKAGLVYDSRNQKQNPSGGIWTELVLFGSPKFLGSDFEFLKVNVTHRQYFSILPQRLNFAYRLGYQATLSGHAPFFFQPIMETSELNAAWSEGLGGARTLRGILRNRIVGDAFAFGNFELRYKIVSFIVAKQNIYIGVNPFFDVGRVTECIETDIAGIADAETYFAPESEKLHFSAGMGLKIAMNENFVLSVEYGKALDKQDGDSGLYIVLNYLF
ncbi:BamA/TamA family outer membrane protein [candidate division KSB1 bacterium]|nr:BamA/TamA family outer membrane protein [candidate division KSB1 bacterium]